MAAARSLSGAVKSLCSIASGNLSGSIVVRRSFAATAPGLGKGGSTRVTVGKMELKANQEAESSWAPDPITGCYRPSNRADEIDPVELREMLLKTKAKPF
ncbi:unnamed protein product [Eruca vesicaria subsp. sativa]|uniref:Late embryogenesis abundant protein Lea5 n=1 Tax=Eruca vesicaria subsp. sativa TaxID=29727 RepID=A0ABC8J9T4_ERUVS|nr:unnamed protein product [Eruca vesicaria subsp. sativa]